MRIYLTDPHSRANLLILLTLVRFQTKLWLAKITEKANMEPKNERRKRNKEIKSADNKYLHNYQLLEAKPI